MIKYCLTIFLLFAVFFACAQNKEIEAKIKFTNAQDLYDKGGIENYMEAVKEVENAEQLLGTPNLKTLYLKILAMHGVSGAYYAYQKKIALEGFFELVKNKPDYPVEKYNEILSIKNLAKGIEEVLREKGLYEIVFAKDYNGTGDCLRREANLCWSLFFIDATYALINDRQEYLKQINNDIPDYWGNNYIDPGKYGDRGVKRLIEEENKHTEYMSESTAKINETVKSMYKNSLKQIENELQQNEFAKRFVFWSKLLAQQNDTITLKNLSYCYAHGLGVLPNRQLAIEYKLQEEKLCKNCDELAYLYFELAQLYENIPIDENWTPDYKKAIEYYKNSFDKLEGKRKGFLAGRIGNMYATKFSYPNAQSKLNAVKSWYETSYELGWPLGMTNLGLLYQSEHPSGTSKLAIEKDNINAVECYKKAADRDSEEAINYLISIYIKGIPGVKKDKNKAKEYKVKVEKLNEEQ